MKSKILIWLCPFPGSSVVKNLPANAGATGDLGSIPGLERSPGGENGNPLQYSCLEKPMDRGAWQATVHGVAKSQTWLRYWAHTHDMPFAQITFVSFSKFYSKEIIWKVKYCWVIYERTKYRNTEIEILHGF